MKTDTKGNNAGELTRLISDALHRGLIIARMEAHDKDAIFIQEVISKFNENYSSPSTEGDVEEFSSRYWERQWNNKSKELEKLEKELILLKTAKEQLSKRKVLEKAEYIMVCAASAAGGEDNLKNEVYFNDIYKAAKQICALSIPQPTQQVSKELIKELYGKWVEYSNLPENSFEPTNGLPFVKWLDGQELK